MVKKQGKNKNVEAKNVKPKGDLVEKTAPEAIGQPNDQDLELLSSSDEEYNSLSDDDDDEEEEEEDDDDDEEEEEEIKDTIKPATSGHKVNKVMKKESDSSTKSASKTKKPKRGIIYIGRLPSEFQENELKTYFNQFGDITNLKLSRNKKTGKSKHFAFLEFDSYSVAQTAAETMNNYLLFGHLIKCQVVDTPHKDLFKNAQRKFKVIPVHKIVKDKHDKPKTKQEWEILVNKFEEAKKKKVQELKSKGIDYDLSKI
ncbi:NOP15 [Candida oxycetoniae]|uniref:NOP15 n=1 Tax=Candida oxycetoniae TaxID=497107 RepID=A0AAI9T0F1_9ASCO|nr:NOP15 [Candida oxycetoniae]KAI3406568.1 NOP15 [Candida oxycetoniae]